MRITSFALFMVKNPFKAVCKNHDSVMTSFLKVEGGATKRGERIAGPPPPPHPSCCYVSVYRKKSQSCRKTFYVTNIHCKPTH